MAETEPNAIREAESKIAGCERCRPDDAQLPFGWILADVLNKWGPYESVMADVAHCSNCRAVIAEKTLVEPEGGIASSTAFTSINLVTMFAFAFRLTLEEFVSAFRLSVGGILRNDLPRCRLRDNAFSGNAADILTADDTVSAAALLVNR